MRALLIAGLLPGPDALADRHPVQYTIEATLDADLRVLHGRFQVRVEVPCRSTELLVLDHAAQVNIPADETDDIEGPRIYPGRVDRAVLDMSFSQEGRPLTMVPTPPPSGWRPGTLRVIHLAHPVARGTPVVLDGAFRLTIPRRFGLFGRIGKQVTLNGGWHPLVIAAGDGDGWHALDAHPHPSPRRDAARWDPCAITLPRSDVALTIHAPPDVRVLVNGRWVEPSLSGPHLVLHGARIASLAAGPIRRIPWPYPLPVRLYDRGKKHRVHRRILKTVSAAVAIWEATALPEPGGDVSIVRVPLRRSLVEEGEQTLWVSDRAFQGDPWTGRYHEYALLHGLFTLWLAPILEDAEPPARAAWLASGLAWFLVDRYRASVSLGYLDLSRAVAHLSFLPEFDEILNAPRFAFSQELYDKAYQADRFRENILDLTGPPLPGRALMMKLEDRLGPRAVRDAAAALFAGAHESFEALLAERAEALMAEQEAGPLDHKGTPRNPTPGAGPDLAPGSTGEAAGNPGGAARSTRRLRDLEALFDNLCPGPPELNYGLTDVAIMRRTDGFATRFDVSCHDLKGQPARPLDPVTVAIVTREGRHEVTWDPTDPSPMTVTTSSRPRRVVLDPGHRLKEENSAGVVLRGDNQVPRAHKLMFAIVPGAWDPDTWRVHGAVSVYLTTPYERRWLWWTNVYTSQQVLVGVSAGVSRFGGPYRNALWRRHQLSFSLHASRRGAWTPESGIDAASLEDFAGIRLSHRYDSRVSYRHPVRGIATYAGVDVGTRETARGTGPYGILTGSVVKPWSWHPRIALVVRVRADVSRGLADDSGQSGYGLLPLGGPYAVRGLSAAGVFGTQRWLVSVEPRWMVVRDSPITVLGIHFSDLQLVGIADAGATGAALHDLTPPVLAVGGGIRLFFDVLAAGQARLGVDMATALTAPQGWQTYVRFGQPF